MSQLETLICRIIAVTLVPTIVTPLAYMTLLSLHSMCFSCSRSKPGIEMGYFVSLGKVFDEIFLGVVFTVFLNKLLHNTLFLRIFGDAPDVLNRLIITHYIPVLVDSRGVVQP
jgi:hypothetical protein